MAYIHSCTGMILEDTPAIRYHNRVVFSFIIDASSQWYWLAARYRDDAHSPACRVQVYMVNERT